MRHTRWPSCQHASTHFGCITGLAISIAICQSKFCLEIILENNVGYFAFFASPSSGHQMRYVGREGSFHFPPLKWSKLLKNPFSWKLTIISTLLWILSFCFTCGNIHTLFLTCAKMDTTLQPVTQITSPRMTEFKIGVDDWDGGCKGIFFALRL